MDIVSKRGIVSVIYKKGNKKNDWWLQTTNAYTTILKNRPQKTDTTIGENESAAIQKFYNT